MTAGLLFMLPACTQHPEVNPRTYHVRGVVEQLKADGRTAVIKHEAIPEYMAAMTMPFHVKDPQLLLSLKPGDEVSFRLLVNESESWIDQVVKTGKTAPVEPEFLTPATQTNAVTSFKLSDIPNFELTNELSQPVSMRQFTGQAVALTFFFTRCPLPEYCPRLSKNFEGASAKLAAIKNGPTNWHFFSISFDPQDLPEVLKAYGERYRYDSNHWSFITGNPDHIKELTRGFGVSVTKDGFFYNHDFGTAVFDASGKLQNLWRFGGDTTDILVNEMLKAAAVTNR